MYGVIACESSDTFFRMYIPLGFANYQLVHYFSNVHQFMNT